MYTVPARLFGVESILCWLGGTHSAVNQVGLEQHSNGMIRSTVLAEDAVGGKVAGVLWWSC